MIPSALATPSMMPLLPSHASSLMLRPLTWTRLLCLHSHPYTPLLDQLPIPRHPTCQPVCPWALPTLLGPLCAPLPSAVDPGTAVLTPPTGAPLPSPGFHPLGPPLLLLPGAVRERQGAPRGGQSLCARFQRRPDSQAGRWAEARGIGGRITKITSRSSQGEGLRERRRGHQANRNRVLEGFKVFSFLSPDRGSAEHRPLPKCSGLLRPADCLLLPCTPLLLEGPGGSGGSLGSPAPVCRGPGPQGRHCDGSPLPRPGFPGQGELPRAGLVSAGGRE